MHAIGPTCTYLGLLMSMIRQMHQRSSDGVQKNPKTVVELAENLWSILNKFYQRHCNAMMASNMFPSAFRSIDTATLRTPLASPWAYQISETFESDFKMSLTVNNALTQVVAGYDACCERTGRKQCQSTPRPSLFSLTSSWLAVWALCLQ